MNSPELVVTGAVSRELTFAAVDLAAMPGTVDNVTAVVPVAIGRAVKVSSVLDAAGPDASATHCTVISAAGDYRASIPLADLRAGGWLAFGYDNGPLPDDRGGPFRLTVAEGSTLCWNVKQVALLCVTYGPEPDDVPENPPH